MAFRDYAYAQMRYRTLTQSMPERAEQLMREAEVHVAAHWRLYEQLAGLPCEAEGEKEPEKAAAKGEAAG